MKSVKILVLALFAFASQIQAQPQKNKDKPHHYKPPTYQHVDNDDSLYLSDAPTTVTINGHKIGINGTSHKAHKAKSVKGGKKYIIMLEEAWNMYEAGIPAFAAICAAVTNVTAQITQYNGGCFDYVSYNTSAGAYNEFLVNGTPYADPTSGYTLWPSSVNGIAMALQNMNIGNVYSNVVKTYSNSDTTGSSFCLSSPAATDTVKVACSNSNPSSPPPTAVKAPKQHH